MILAGAAGLIGTAIYGHRSRAVAVRPPPKEQSSRRSVKEVSPLWQRSAELRFDRLIGTYGSRPISELVTIRGGGTPSKAIPLYWKGKVSWVTPKDMKNRELGDTIDHISEQAVAETPAKLIAPGAVLIVVRGMILAHTVPCCVLRTSAAINQDMKALVPNGEMSPEFLCSMLWAHNRSMVELVEKSTHDTRKLETSKLLDIRIPFPSPSEQSRVVAELTSFLEEVGSLTRLQTKTTTELDALLPAILDRAFQGSL
jgi:type I restriction enzyme S subunit